MELRPDMYEGVPSEVLKKEFTLSTYLDDLKSKRDAARDSQSGPTSEEQSLIRLVGRLDDVPGLAALPGDTVITYKEVDELMLLLDLLKDADAVKRILGDDTFPSTIIGQLQFEFLKIGTSKADMHNRMTRLIQVETEKPGVGRRVAMGWLALARALQDNSKPPNLPSSAYNYDPAITPGMQMGMMMGIIPRGAMYPTLGDMGNGDYLIFPSVQSIYTALGSHGPEAAVVAVMACAAVRNGEQASNGRLKDCLLKLVNFMTNEFQGDSFVAREVIMSVVAFFGDPMKKASLQHHARPRVEISMPGQVSWGGM